MKMKMNASDNYKKFNSTYSDSLEKLDLAHIWVAVKDTDSLTEGEFYIVEESVKIGDGRWGKTKFRIKGKEHLYHPGKFRKLNESEMRMFSRAKKLDELLG